MEELATITRPAPHAAKPGANWHWLLRYGLVILVFAAIVGLGILNSRYNVRLNLTIPIVLAVVAVAWYGGRGPGFLLSVLFQATTIIYAPVPPDSSVAKNWFGYFSTFALYIFLVMVITGLKKVQHRLSSQGDLLQVTLASIGEAVMATDTDGNITFMNPAAQSLTGWSESAATGQPLDRVFNIVNEETGLKALNPVERALDTGAVIGLANHTVLIARDGSKIPIEDTAAPIRHNGKVRGVVLVFSDVTERKLAEKSRRESEIMHRLVEAQEAERHRIARDLHDHLGQRMTALRLRIEGLNDKAVADKSLSRAIGEVQASASQVDRDIGFLSWELRPTELEDLGLIDALNTFVREWAAQYDINAQFHANLSPSPAGEGMSRQAETNIYRIVQEALNNVLKHAGARNVSVLLHHRGNDLVIIIEDDGRGFDPDVLPNPDAPSRGLGLVGMRERAALLGGALDVDSESGSGTTIIAKIPLIEPRSL